MRAALALLLAAALGAASAFPQDDASVDPLDPLRPALERQDALLDQGTLDAAVAEARDGLSAGSAEAWYLFGRALGNAGLARLRAKQEAEGQRLLDDSLQAFEKSKEQGGLLFAPAHLGIARVARTRGNLDTAVEELRAALRISRNFKAAAIELAQVLWEKRLPNEAEFALHQFLDQRAGDTDARMLLGMFKLQRKRWAEAEPEFRAVLEAEPRNTGARKLLAADLMYQDKFEESAQQWELVRSADPKDDESYMSLFHLYRRLRRRDDAVGVLTALARELPGTEAARRGQALLDDLAKDPRAFDEPDRPSPEALVKRLDSSDPVVVARTLCEMRGASWAALPAGVYRLLGRDASDSFTRLMAIRLIADQADPRTVPILEILLFHPKEREPDAVVRRDVARALSRLATDAVVPILERALDDPDADVREWAVQGIADRTGRWFRRDLLVRSDPRDWPQERESYRRWWTSSSASPVKRSAARALGELYGSMTQGKARVALYALPAMDDASEATWRAGYDLFRALSFVTFGSETGPAAPEERLRITGEARAWLQRDAQGGR